MTLSPGFIMSGNAVDTLAYTTLNKGREHSFIESCWRM